MKKADEAALAWRAIHLLTELQRFLWDCYRPEFIRLVEKHANEQLPHPPPNDPPSPE